MICSAYALSIKREGRNLTKKKRRKCRGCCGCCIPLRLCSSIVRYCDIAVIVTALVGGPGEILCDVHPQEFSAADSLHSRAVDGQWGVVNRVPPPEVQHNLLCLPHIEGQIVCVHTIKPAVPLPLCSAFHRCCWWDLPLLCHQRTWWCGWSWTWQCSRGSAVWRAAGWAHSLVGHLCSVW